MMHTYEKKITCTRVRNIVLYFIIATTTGAPTTLPTTTLTTVSETVPSSKFQINLVSYRVCYW